MVIGILQPGYLPWLGFFEQLARSDVFVVYDDVQYDKHSWRNRNRIKTANGIQWLTVPVRFSLDSKQLVKDVEIDNSQKWRKKHADSLRQSYGKAPFFSEIWPLFAEVYDREWEKLVDLDMHFIERIGRYMGLERKIIKSSTLAVEGGKIDRLLALCQYFGADVFYEGAAGRNYIHEEAFEKGGVKVLFQDYSHPVYNQLHGDFVSYLSIADLLFNCGRESLAILAAANK